VPIALDPVRSRLQEVQVVDDPSPGDLVLNPGDRVSGVVDLSQRFPDLAAAVRERDVIVFWSYEFKPRGRPAFPRLTGGVILPREGP